MPIKIQQQKAVEIHDIKVLFKQLIRVICDKGIPGSSDNAKLMFPR